MTVSLISPWRTASRGDSVSVLIGIGDGTFEAQVEYPVGDRPYSVAIGDFDGDGVPDLAVANWGNSDAVSVLIGIGDGTFEAQVMYPVGSSPTSVAIGDLDGDGVPDLAVSNSNGNVSVLLNQCDFCPADLDDNNMVGTTDLLALLAAWGTDPGGPPDFDDDQNVGVTDLLFLLSLWGQCP